MSGLSRTPGKRVQGNTLTGVRIPLSPPGHLLTGAASSLAGFVLAHIRHTQHTFECNAARLLSLFGRTFGTVPASPNFPSQHRASDARRLLLNAGPHVTAASV